MENGSTMIKNVCTRVATNTPQILIRKKKHNNFDRDVLLEWEFVAAVWQQKLANKWNVFDDRTTWKAIIENVEFSMLIPWE